MTPATPPPMTYTVVDSPIGPLTLVGRRGTLCALYMVGHSHAADPGSYGRREDRGFDAAVEQLDEYFAGRRTSFDLRLEAPGTPFQHQVWDALVRIPYGTTTTYGRLAEAIGRPGASRAVGLANGRNPLSIVVPCHRVIGAGGDLTGYGGGLERKAHLLAHERNVRAGASPGSPVQLGLLDLAEGVAG
jgi:methylated-DNA-[protein]-cysteine S-methyltransferase